MTYEELSDLLSAVEGIEVELRRQTVCTLANDLMKRGEPNSIRAIEEARALYLEVKARVK